MDRLGYALDDRFYGVSGSHLEVFRNRMREAALAEVNAAVKTHLQYGNMHVVFVTRDARSLKDRLVRDAPSPIDYPSPKPPAILEEDKQIAAFPLKAPAENVRIVPVEDLFVK
jgi:zinc protease